MSNSCFSDGVCSFKDHPLTRSDILNPLSAAVDQETKLKVVCIFDKLEFNLLDFRKHIRKEHPDKGKCKASHALRQPINEAENEVKKKNVKFLPGDSQRSSIDSEISK
jgi:hypothetical protein